MTPLKTITIPRLELAAALLSIKISKLLKTAFKYQINEEYFWTDSTIVLCYLRNDTRRFMTYVANRIEQIKEQIKEHTTVNQWYYMASESNPADHASRSLDVKSLITSNWFNGLHTYGERSLPDESQIDSNLSENDQVVRAQVMQTTMVLDDTNIFDRFSSWFTAVRVISNCLKFKELLKKRLVKERKDTHAELDPVEQIERSKLCIIRCLQRNVYHDEIQFLCNEKHIPTNNKLASLDPFLDNYGLLRVGGRLTSSSFMYGVKHPLIMPASSHITRMLIGYYHEKPRHQGRGLTMNAIRTSGIWIIGCSRAVASYIYKCVTCRLIRGKALGQRMADLPKERIEESPPFTYVGLDCFGPFITKDGRRTAKRYGLLVTCFSTRAEHIEYLENMTSDSFHQRTSMCDCYKRTCSNYQV